MKLIRSSAGSAAIVAALVLAGCNGGSPSAGSAINGITTAPYNAQPAPVAFTQNIIEVPNVPVPVAPAPPGPYWSFDIGATDATNGIYYLADKTNCGVDVFDAKGNAFTRTIGPAAGFSTFPTVGASCASVGSVFSGNTGSSKSSGPNGVVLISSTKIYAGDGNGTVKIVNPVTKAVTGTIVIPTAKYRTDEGSYDPVDNIVMIDSDSETAPLETFIDAGTDTVLGQIVRSDATAGMEGSLYDPTLKAFLQAVPATTKNKVGEVDVIDPNARKVTAVYPLPSACAPTGIAEGPNETLVVACGNAAATFLMSAANGRILAQINQAGGGDEAAYDATTNRFYVANSNNTFNGAPFPVLTVINAATLFFIQNIPSQAHAHSVATYNGKVFEPLPQTGVSVYQ